MDSNNYIVRLDKIKKKYNLKNDIYVKLEQYSITNSIKDKVAKMIVEKSHLKEGEAVIDCSSGNYGIALGYYLYNKNINLILVIPKSISNIKKEKLRKFKAKLIEIDGNMNDCYNYVKKVIKTNSKLIFLNQFENINSYKAHKETAQEIIKKFKDNTASIYLSLGSSATYTGLKKYLKSNYKIRVVQNLGFNVEGVYGGILATYYIKEDCERIKVSYDFFKKVKEDITNLELLNLGDSSILNICGALLDSDNTTKVAIAPDSGDNYE